jgi:hypothetical protein
MADETMQGPANLSDGAYEGGGFGDNDEDQGITEYNPDKGQWGPDPYGIGENRTEAGIPQDSGQQQQYQRQEYQPQYDQNGQPLEQIPSPLEQISPYLQDNELQFLHNLPPEHQEYFVNALSRIDDAYKVKEQEVLEYEQQLSEAGERVQDLAEVEDLVAPKLEGTQYENVGDYFSTLVEADMQFAENPTYAIINLMEHYGIKLDDLYNDAIVKFNKESDPHYQEAQRLREEKEALALQAEQYQSQLQATQDTETLNFFQDQINQFSVELDEYGQYTHPYFSLVEPKMTELLEQQGNYDLEDLYQQACWLTPEVRNDMIAQGYYGENQYAPGGEVAQAQQQYGAPANYQQYATGPTQAQQVAKFATSNSPGETNTVFGNKDGFKEAFERNYARINQNPY